ncbi:Ribosomal L22e protein [Malassezia psittaci]|uniref:Ribosomal L22e protein n=1 Tax=Malassezia psittaci TaxID=1821823 RepID=A0AAF0FAF6_9BASI|nr:Ribosomal L22e protein [Malassezia psittaci]
MAVTKSNKVVGSGASKGANAKGNNFFIDFSGPANDGVLDGDAFEKYLHDRIKVDGKAGQLGDAVQISREGDGKIWVKTTIPFSKRYLKYLTKRFLKRSELRDWLRVVATSKPGFEIKFFNVSYDQEEEEEADEE